MDKFIIQKPEFFKDAKAYDFFDDTNPQLLNLLPYDESVLSEHILPDASFLTSTLREIFLMDKTEFSKMTPLQSGIAWLLTRERFIQLLSVKSARQVSYMYSELLDNRKVLTKKHKRISEQLHSQIFQKQYADILQILAEPVSKKINNMLILIDELNKSIKGYQSKLTDVTKVAYDNLYFLHSDCRQTILNLQTELETVKKEHLELKFEYSDTVLYCENTVTYAAIIMNHSQSLEKKIKKYEQMEEKCTQLKETNKQLQMNIDQMNDKIKMRKKIYQSAKISLKTHIEGIMEKFVDSEKKVFEVLKNYDSFVAYITSKNVERQAVIDKHKTCDCCEHINPQKYFSFPLSPYVVNLIDKVGLTNIQLTNPKKCSDIMKKMHLKCVTYLCNNISSKSSLFYRHFLIKDKNYDLSSLDKKFFATFLSPDVFVKNINKEEFFSNTTKKKTYFKYYLKLDKEGGFRNLCYNLSSSNLKDYTIKKSKQLNIKFNQPVVLTEKEDSDLTNDIPFKITVY